jgi:hypothetical protein
MEGIILSIEQIKECSTIKEVKELITRWKA